MIRKILTDFLNDNNYISEAEALDETVVGMPIFDNPLIGYADANDELFEILRNNEEATYGRFLPPKEWLKESRTIISIFFPYSQQVKLGNSRDMKVPSNEWLHARYEGQNRINDFSKLLRDTLIKEGYQCVVPSIDERFKSEVGTWTDKDVTLLSNRDYGSNWSERHVAYVAGLGTFGLSKGLITEKGITGRFTSTITNLQCEPTQRKYSGLYDYCTMCGKCALNCPPKAINLSAGKKHTPCARFLDWAKEEYRPRYGCGKCQVDVPCADGIPR